MPSPLATPKKRACRHFNDREHILRYSPNTPPRQDWLSSLNHFVDAVVTLWNDIPHPTVETHLPAPMETTAGYHDLLVTLIEVSTSAHRMCVNIGCKYNLQYQWQLPVLTKLGPTVEHPQPPLPKADQTPLPPPAASEEPEPEPKPKPQPQPQPQPEPEPEPEPEPMPPSRPPSRSYAAAAASHAPHWQHQALPRSPPSTRKAKPTTFKPVDPVRIVVQLTEEPTLPVQNLSAPELFRRLTDACSKSPNAPAPLGAQRNRKNNLIILFPAGTTHTAIKSLYPNICLLLGSTKPTICFVTPWCKLHLAGIRARNSPDQPIASNEELCQTLLRNPALQALNITIQPTWLKKPDNIVGTHTSAIIAFEDPDGAIGWALLKLVIFAFGKLVTVKKWYKRPPIRT